MWNRELYQLCFCHPLTCTNYLWTVSFKSHIIRAGVRFACLLALTISQCVHYRDNALDFLLARILLTEVTHCLSLVSMCGWWLICSELYLTRCGWLSHFQFYSLVVSLPLLLTYIYIYFMDICHSVPPLQNQILWMKQREKATDLAILGLHSDT